MSETANTSTHIALILPDLGGGGAERVAVNLANSFACRGHRVDMVLLSASGVFLANLRPEIRVVNLNVKRFRWALFPLVRYLLRARPAAVLACMWPLTVIMLCARGLSRVNMRVVVAEHTTWSIAKIVRSGLTRWLARTTMHYAFLQCDAVIAVSHGAADDLARFACLPRDAITVIYNPVVGEAPPSVSRALEPEGWWSGSHRRVLAVGALKAVKDYATLLTAFAELRQRIDARLLILGEGECRPALEAQARQLDIAASVFMPGFVSDPSPYYAHADLHVLSSTGEGFGNVIVEALAAGTPVVSTDCPSGPREILVDGLFGALVPVGDAVALAHAIEVGLLTPHNKQILQARAADFSIDKAVDQYENLLIK